MEMMKLLQLQHSISHYKKCRELKIFRQNQGKITKSWSPLQQCPLLVWGNTASSYIERISRNSMYYCQTCMKWCGLISMFLWRYDGSVFTNKQRWHNAWGKQIPQIILIANLWTKINNKIFNESKWSKASLNNGS